MAPRAPNNVFDVLDDDAQNEDATVFFPVTSDGMWSPFLGGMLIGIAGSGLVTVAPWLAGLLIVIGYGMAALNLKASRKGTFLHALSFGYGLMTALGCALLFGALVFPAETASLISWVSNKQPLFIWLSVAAWPIALLKYIATWLASLKKTPVRTRLSARDGW